jgi:hypothetical protein
MPNRRKFISDSLKILLGAGIGFAGSEYMEKLAPYGFLNPLDQLFRNWNSQQPINPNGNFSEGEKYWAPHISPGLQTSTWGYNVVTNQFGQVWIDNPLVGDWGSANDHVAMYQDFNSVKWAGIRKSDLMLKDRRFVLEADVRVDEDTERITGGFGRAAIAFTIMKPDESNYTVDGSEHKALYMELDFYRRNTSYIGGPPSDSFTYPADQIPPGYWKHFALDVTDLITNGFNGRGGWGESTYNQSMLWAWYLVVEVQGSKTSASWRKVRLFEE